MTPSKTYKLNTAGGVILKIIYLIVSVKHELLITWPNRPSNFDFLKLQSA